MQKKHALVIPTPHMHPTR